MPTEIVFIFGNTYFGDTLRILVKNTKYSDDIDFKLITH